MKVDRLARATLCVAMTVVLFITPLGCGGDEGTGSGDSPVDGVSSRAGDEADDPEDGGQEDPNGPPSSDQLYVSWPLDLPEVVAEFDGEKILRLELEDHIIRRKQKAAFARYTLVFGNILSQALKKRGVTTSSDEIDAEMAKVLETSGMDLPTLLASKRYDEPYLRRQVQARLEIKKYAVAIGRHSPGNVDEKINYVDQSLLEQAASECEVKFRPHGIPDDAFCLVNGTPIPQKEMLRWSCVYLRPRDVLKLLDEVIAIRVDRALVERQGIEVDMSKVEAEMASNERKYQGILGYDFSLAMEGRTREEYREVLWRQFGVQAFLERPPPDEELRIYYTQHRDDLKLGDRVHVRDLFISENAFRKPDAEASDASWESARKAMDLAWEELQGGAVFDEAFVTKHSTDARRKAAGGDLGWLTLDNAQFAGLRDRALLLEKDALTEPFRTRHGFHILHVMDRKYAYSLEKAMETPNVRKRVLGKFVVFGKNAARQVERSRHDVKIHLSF